MDPSTSPHIVIKHDNDQNIPDDEKIKLMILAFNEKIKLNPLVISDPANYQSLHLGASKSNISVKEDEEGIDQKGMISRNAYQPAEVEEELWPKITELNDRPPSPTSQSIAIKQVIRESTYNLSPKHAELDDDRPPSPVVDESKPTTQMISKSAYQSPKQTHDEAEQDSWPSSPDLQKPGIMKPKLQYVIRGDAYQQSSEATLDVLPLNSSSPLGSDIVKPRVHMIRDPSIQSPTHDQSTQGTIRESYKSSAQGRLPSVVEESESFSRREFGDNMLNYMSTFSSATHASNLSSLRANDFGAFDYKHVSYRHNNYHQFTYNLSTSNDPGSGSFMNSKSAPAGTATRTGSAFGLFRRGTSERSGLKMGRRTVYRPRKPRKPRTLATTLLWPLLKIRNGYVGCMMGLEGTGDLTGMAQGGSYATAARYFSDIPLSKSDSRNYG